MRICPVLLVLFVTLTLGLASSAQEAGTPDELTVVAYNVENYFDVFDDPYSDDDGTAVKARVQIQALANAIAALDADVVFLQEIENEAALVGMVAEFLPDAGYLHAIVMPTNSTRGINLGVLSRVPVLSATSHRWKPFFHPDDPSREPYYFARDLQEIHLDVGRDAPLIAFNVHLKSNSSRDGDPRSMKWRTAEAAAVKDATRAILADDPEAWVIAAGDFNSDFMVAPDQEGPWPAMAHLREPETAGPFRGKRVLVDVHDGLPRKQRESHPGDAFYPPANFDYILASPALAARLVPGSARVFDEEALTTGSDHRPVVATFRLSEQSGR